MENNVLVPQQCFCGCRKLVVDQGELRCDDCDLIVAEGVKVVNGTIETTSDFVNWVEGI